MAGKRKGLTGAPKHKTRKPPISAPIQMSNSHRVRTKLFNEACTLLDDIKERKKKAARKFADERKRVVKDIINEQLGYTMEQFEAWRSITTEGNGDPRKPEDVARFLACCQEGMAAAKWGEQLDWLTVEQEHQRRMAELAAPPAPPADAAAEGNGDQEEAQELVH
jgi:hypothetical protein